MLEKRIFLYIFTLTSTYTLAQKSFTFQNQFIEPGTKSQFEIPVISKTDSTFIPVTIFRGTKPGPVLGITAGIHGYEYPPILAAQQLNQKIDPKQLSGTIILVQIANVPAFLSRSPFINPLDGKNLNRSFPGNSKGSITQRMAYIITSEVIAKSDYFVDMHAGDAPEDLRSYNAWYQSKALPEVSKKGREMALAMEFDYSIIFNIPEERLKKPSLYCSQEAFHRKIPSVDIECGRLGVPGKTETDRIVKGMFLLLAHLKMIDLNKQSVLTKPTIIAQRFTIKSKSTGLFYTEKKRVTLLKRGSLLAILPIFLAIHYKRLKHHKME
ncbi:M14 family metallopeptidase [Aquimarina gracilis]|uniref:M14 family metallopeptidase n=1 Tax=Aquimarina gracilis TaxID=874422 RepID=A0ABU5ZUX1_9FLAO|nr:M14 family metallopeptidase [Aquimarina gracilis]MEB3345823.1 M14 family metallopeptidase [Aquimarina gracilis]